MAKTPPGSEFDGRPQRNTLMPPKTPKGHPGHTADRLTADERLRLLYLTGQTEDTTVPPDGGVSFQGLSEEEAISPELYRDRWK